MRTGKRIASLGLALVLAPLMMPVAFAQSTGTPVPAPGSGSALTGQNGTTEGSGANNSKPVGGPGLTGTPYTKTKKRTNRHMYGKHYNVQKHSKR